MKFAQYFKFISYTLVLCGFLSLWISGTLGILITVIFLFSLISALVLEETRWQISERIGTVLVFVIVPLFYIGWKFQLLGVGNNDTALAGVLARLILGLSVIKLLQKKSDRDWIFLYLMSFFEVLLAAALSISLLYLTILILYFFTGVITIISFEIKKTSRIICNEETIIDYDNKLNKSPFRKLPTIAISLVIFIIIFAAPMFFLLPRVGGAGFGANQSGISALTGFSDKVRLGEIGRIQQNDEIVMRVQIENKDAKSLNGLRWRGIALDEFDNKTWKQSKQNYRETSTKNESGFFLLNFSSGKNQGIIQTFYLEPLDTLILFTLPRPNVVQGNFEILKKDAEGGISFIGKGYQRISYQVHSDGYEPSAEILRKDNINYTAEENQKYLQLPADLDEKIEKLSSQITEGKTNRYDKAKVIEEYLQTQFGYTLEQKATGEQPVSDFLFNVKEGHCEYFASAMVLMLRTQGIASRIVNGFQQGEYNETADVFVVKQKNAHSWVEVYFPKEKTWVAFDPTPFAGQNFIGDTTGLFGSMGSYLEALETFWIQYFIAFDNQEQRSLFRSVKDGFIDFQSKISGWLESFQEKVQDWWSEVRGERGLQASAWAIAYGVAVLAGIIFGYWFFRRLLKYIKSFQIWHSLIDWLKRRKQKSIVEFYERMERVLASKGLNRQSHQTPLEFAFALNIPEAVSITEKYNRVRFGKKNLSNDEVREIESWLEKLEQRETKI
jgi:hypothetical protein